MFKLGFIFFFFNLLYEQHLIIKFSVLFSVAFREAGKITSKVADGFNVVFHFCHKLVADGSIGLCCSLHYRVMVHARSLESTREA